MTENKEILNKLISEKKEKTKILDMSNLDNDSLATASRVVQVRYRFYAVGVALLILLILFRLVLPAFAKYGDEQSELSVVKQKLQQYENREKQYKDNIGFVEQIQTLSPQIISCLNINKSSGCQEIPQDLQKDFGLARSYLLAYDMNNDKMDVDERKIIENIDNFLLKVDPFSKSPVVNGMLNKISIGDKQKFNDGLYFVPIQLDITFASKNALLSFINNVEKHVPPEESLRVLYKIDKITYDIVNSQEAQDTSVYMYLYFYDK